MNIKRIAIILVALGALGGGVWWYATRSTTEKSGSTADSSKTTNSAQQAPSVKLAEQTVGKPADCSTYSFGELSGVWGTPFVDTDINNVSKLSTNGGKQYSCTYNETDSGTGLSFSIEYREHPSVDDAKQSMQDTLSTEKLGDTVYYKREDVANTGDQAFLWAKNRSDGSKEVNQQLYVRKANVVFLLSAVNLDGVKPDYKTKLVEAYKLHFN